ncbi:MAG TPA: EAL domain-containing protein [Mycobacteriales bacterium]|nr:EAL domain-containing protein [Mycobacteriales bacterium]
MTVLDLDLASALAHAAEDDTLVLHLQPEVDLASGAVVGMEALVRWQHPDRGMLWPAEFLPVAQRSGVLPSIGGWVLRQAVAELAAWQRLPARPYSPTWQLWVNVAAVEVVQPGFVELVCGLVRDAQLPRGVLGIEITEEALAVGGAEVLAGLQTLRAAGVALAIDDFGTWYSSLATLGDLPVDAIKLDQTFVRGVGSDLEDDDIVAAVIRLAHARDLLVVAEGVESWAEGARLCELGCDRGQGYLFSGPQPLEKARWMLARGTGWRGSAGDPAAVASRTADPAPAESTSGLPQPRRAAGQAPGGD